MPVTAQKKLCLSAKLPHRQNVVSSKLEDAVLNISVATVPLLIKQGCFLCPHPAAAEPGGYLPPQLYQVELLLAVTNRVVHYNQRELESDDIKSVNR